MLRKFLLTTAALMGLAAMAHADEVEVLHWWTSGGEAAALNVLKKTLEGQGVTWKDMPVAGGGGEAAMTALRAALPPAIRQPPCRPWASTSPTGPSRAWSAI